MSTCLSCPLDSFFTLTLQPNRSTVAVRAPKRRNAGRLFLSMFRPSTGNLDRTLQACPAFGDGAPRLVARPRRDARISIDYARVRNAGAEFPAKGAAGIRAHVVGEEHRNNLIVRLLLCGIRKTALRGSLVPERRFEGQNLAIVAHQRNGGIGHLLAERPNPRLAPEVGEGGYGHHPGIPKGP